MAREPEYLAAQLSLAALTLTNREWSSPTALSSCSSNVAVSCSINHWHSIMHPALVERVPIDLTDVLAVHGTSTTGTKCTPIYLATM